MGIFHNSKLFFSDEQYCKAVATQAFDRHECSLYHAVQSVKRKRNSISSSFLPIKFASKYHEKRTPVRTTSNCRHTFQNVAQRLIYRRCNVIAINADPIKQRTIKASLHKDVTYFMLL